MAAVPFIPVPMTTYRIQLLDNQNPAQVRDARDLLLTAFADPLRYDTARIEAALRPAPPPFYRQFFVARQDQQVCGVAGIQAADWATRTHLLFLSAVAPSFRHQGIGRALVEARLNWLRQHHAPGRVLVSTAKPRRFKQLGFRIIAGSRKEGRWLMRLEMPAEPEA
ncbi:MAG: hypothetical protein RIR00_1085 [Pseudomonadota bacterium]|jgi:predicted N-acetyltransferase YhbS